MSNIPQVGTPFSNKVRAYVVINDTHERIRAAPSYGAGLTRKRKAVSQSSVTNNALTELECGGGCLGGDGRSVWKVDDHTLGSLLPGLTKERSVYTKFDRVVSRRDTTRKDVASTDIGGNNNDGKNKKTRRKAGNNPRKNAAEDTSVQTQDDCENISGGLELLNQELVKNHVKKVVAPPSSETCVESPWDDLHCILMSVNSILHSKYY